eukprot:2181426-Ditylum_brightwellii.AAC.1
MKNFNLTGLTEAELDAIDQAMSAERSQRTDATTTTAASTARLSVAPAASTPTFVAWYSNTQHDALYSIDEPSASLFLTMAHKFETSTCTKSILNALCSEEAPYRPVFLIAEQTQTKSPALS